MSEGEHLDSGGTVRAIDADYSACRPPDALLAERPVSRGTLVDGDSNGRRRYASPARMERGRETRAALIGAALALIAGSNFRPTGRQLADRARSYDAAVGYHFGTIELMYRVLAREQPFAIAKAAGLGALPAPEQRRLVWLLMTGSPEDGAPR